MIQKKQELITIAIGGVRRSYCPHCGATLIRKTEEGGLECIVCTFKETTLIEKTGTHNKQVLAMIKGTFHHSR